MIPVALVVSVLALQDPAPAAAGPSADTQAVEKGALELVVDAEGTFEAADPFEVRLKLKAYAGDLTVVSAAGHGAAVKSGDVLLRLDGSKLKEQLDAAESDLRVARATLAKTEKEGKLTEQGDALALKAQQEALKSAEASAKYWETIDGPHLLKNIELEVLGSRDSVSDQQEELDQLKKMYKSEELTNETSEIVVKRAVRALERSKVRLSMTEESAQKQKDFDVPNAARAVTQALEQARLQLALLQNTQALGAVTREADLLKAKAAVATAEERVADLKADLEALTVKAPADGVVLCGQLQQGAWQNNDPRTLRAGEKVQAAQVLMTLYRPGRLVVNVDLPEGQLFWVQAGMKAKVTPAALAEAAMDGTTRAPSIVGATKGVGQTFSVLVDVSNVDARLAPGMKASVHVDVAELRDVLRVPSTAVSRGRVWVRGADGKDQAREVVVGRSDGKCTEIKSGLREGESVLIQAKK